MSKKGAEYLKHRLAAIEAAKEVIRKAIVKCNKLEVTVMLDKEGHLGTWCKISGPRSFIYEYNGKYHAK